MIILIIVVRGFKRLILIETHYYIVLYCNYILLCILYYTFEVPQVSNQGDYKNLSNRVSQGSTETHIDYLCFH